MAVVRNRFPFSYENLTPAPAIDYSYYICDTNAELAALTGYNEGDLAYSKEAHMLYFRTNSAWAAVA